MKDTSEEGTATIWLTTAEMGFSLTEEQDDVVCTKDVKEGKITDRFLAPAISQFAADMRRKVVTGADTDRQTTDVRRKLEDLHQRWGRANVTPNSKDIKAQAGNEAKVTNRFIRIIQRKDLPWENIPLRGQRMIPSTSQIAMFRLRLDNTSSFTSRF